MKLQVTHYLNTPGPPPPIAYKPDPMIGKTPTDKSDSLMVDVKTQLEDRDSKIMEMYVLLFRLEIPEALLKFLMMLKNIIKGQDLSTGSQKYRISHNIMFREYLQTF